MEEEREGEEERRVGGRRRMTEKMPRGETEVILNENYPISNTTEIVIKAIAIDTANSTYDETSSDKAPSTIC